MVRIAAVSVAVLLVLASAFVVFVSWRSAQSLIHPARDQPPDDPSTLGIAYENVSFTTSDGIGLVGWWMPERAPGHNGTVVFLHGYGESKNQSLKVAPFLVDAAWDVLAFDMRAHGDSGGDTTTVGLEETKDVRAAVDHLAARGDVDMSRLALYGFSMGGATAINGAGHVPEARAIVSDSSFATLQNIASNSITHFTGLPKYPFGPLAVLFAGWMAGADVGDNNPVHAIAAQGRPVLVIQGADDTIAYPAGDGEALRDRAPPGSEYWLVPGAKHVRAVDVAPDEYEARVLAFLAKHAAT